MRTVAFARYGDLVWVLTVAVCLLLSAAPATAADSGVQIFNDRCSECHGSRSIALWGRKEPDAAKRRAWIDGVLRKHYPPTDDDRQAIIDHIQASLASQRK